MVTYIYIYNRPLEMYSVSICYYLSIYATFAHRNFDRSNSFVLDLENRTISNLSLRLTNKLLSLLGRWLVFFGLEIYS